MIVDYLEDLTLSRAFNIVEGGFVPCDSFDRMLDSSLSGDGQDGPAVNLVGTIIDEKYEVLSLLGRGGMGTVYHVRHRLLGKEMALKTFHRGEISQEAWTRFQREARAIAKLTHANIVQ